ncbi:MAG: hypothetical protein DWQ36_09820 [Acidobacteria bacterium]|nr:MAG: hypothetical protein DWQ30_01100 [Acidobacteriota bacterium]REK08358.1 MAG: hypothetical protein DWQ36_09820 [Acidobacteriota bacterium]
MSREDRSSRHHDSLSPELGIARPGESLVEVLRTDDRTQLAVVRALLESADIPSHEPTGDFGRLAIRSLLGGGERRGSYRLLVRAGDAETAAELIAQTREPVGDDEDEGEDDEHGAADGEDLPIEPR